MAFTIDVTVQNAQANGVMTLINGGSIDFFEGTKPATTGDADNGVLLATLTLSSPTAPNATAGVASATLPIESTNTVAGTVGYARVRDSGGNVKLDGSTTTAGGGGDIIVNTLTLNAGDLLKVLSFSITASP